MSASMTPQNSLGVDIVGIIVTPAYMINRNQDIIEILQGLNDRTSCYTDADRTKLKAID